MLNMRNFFYLFVLLLLGAPAAPAQESTQLVQKVRDKLSKVKNYRAEAVMFTDIPFLKIPSSHVTVFYKDPDKFRIQQEGGISITPKGGMDINLNGLFAMKNFTALDAGTIVYKNKNMRVVKILPLEEGSRVVISTLYIDPVELLIHKAATTSKDNGTFEIEMSYGRYAAWGLPDKAAFLFNTREYKLPKGIAFDYETNAGKNKRPASATTNEKGSVRLEYTSYQINKGVPDSVFNR
jgi:hypothetical protein